MIYQTALATAAVALCVAAVAGIVMLLRRRHTQTQLPSLDQLRQATADGKLQQRIRARAETRHREATSGLLKEL